MSERDSLVTELTTLRQDLIALEHSVLPQLPAVRSSHVESARNLLHYLALRRHDVRELQERLTAMGLSSLGRAEGSVLTAIDAVLRALRGQAPGAFPAATAPSPNGNERLDRNTEALLGHRPLGRGVRIMVTMPAEAADDPKIINELLARGMNCMRINCAHDDAQHWARMIANLRRAEDELGKRCRILMDLPGPKLRTGPLEPGPEVVKIKPARDLLGRVTRPARVWLTPVERPSPAPGPAIATLPVPGAWLSLVAAGTRIKLSDARDAQRTLEVVEAVDDGRWAESSHTSYVTSGMALHHSVADTTTVGRLPAQVVPIVLKPGDHLTLTREQVPGRPAGAHGVAHISCTLAEVFADVRPGDSIWLDDGKIGGVVRNVDGDALDVEVTRARATGETLGADKGVNLPDTKLRLPALGETDLQHLAFIAQHADLVGFSFVHHPADVLLLRERLAALDRPEIGVVLKIETRAAFEELPSLLLAAMANRSTGVMIARGDLAVECGYQRLAEVQEEILWICEAAHVPVIWATQVLESLAKHGLPSRAEITDAAMGERAECVMLNKGPHCVEAVEVLDDILTRMEAHQRKKRAMLRPLKLAARFHAGHR